MQTKKTPVVAHPQLKFVSSSESFHVADYAKRSSAEKICIATGAIRPMWHLL